MNNYKLIDLEVPGALRIEGELFQDSRGLFTSPFRESVPVRIKRSYANVYVSYNTKKFTLRGFHYQKAPKGENKIVTALTGSALHVVIAKLDNGRFCLAKNYLNQPNISSFVPDNAASAFLTLESNTVIHYLSDSPYDPQLSSGYLWNDPTIGFDWGVSSSEITISDRDLQFPLI